MSVVSQSIGRQVDPIGSQPPRWLLGLLGLLMGFASLSTDFYLPALPSMAASLGATQRSLELTVSGYLAGFSFGQLVWGPLGDSLGRKRPVFAGLVLFIAGSIGCAVATSANMVILCRVVQAFGASAGVVLSRAMVRDLYRKNEAARMMSTLITIMGAIPLVAPWFGGQILAAFGWRAIFWVLVVFAVAAGSALVLAPETLPESNRTQISRGANLARYARLMRDPHIQVCALIGAAYYMGLFAHIAGTPFAFIQYHHVSPQIYGLLFASGIVGLMVTNQVNVRLLDRFGLDLLVKFGGALAVSFGVLLAICSVTDAGGIWGLFLPGIGFVSTSGFLVANSLASALDRHPASAGAVSALLGAAQFGAGMVGSGLVGLMANGTAMPMGLVIGISSIVVFFAARRIASDRHTP